ncbi:MAG: hypothetical protein JW395_0599 [Nitrospira sp.]|nr:hypothetical protein [Nitrospira sp.]
MSISHDAPGSPDNSDDLPLWAASQPRPAPPDPFDPASLRIGSDYASGLGVKKVLLTIPVRKPNKTEWFRVRPGDDWRLQTTIFETEGLDRTTYIVTASLREEFGANLSAAVILTCVNRAGDVFLWRIKLPGPDGRANPWTESSMGCAVEAERGWCRMVANMGAGNYDLFTATAGWTDPKWPDVDFPAILKIAFRDRLIDSAEHPVLRDLRGLS